MGEGDKMGIAMLLEWPGETQEQYEQLMRVLALDENPPEGGVFHVCGPIPGGWRVLEVWESEEAFWRFFNERLRPAVREVGIPAVAKISQGEIRITGETPAKSRKAPVANEIAPPAVKTPSPAVNTSTANRINPNRSRASPAKLIGRTARA
jgi:hypothetical protein